ncbi:MAG: GNAT family N-acetyltransferase [Candidatus Pacearchaeota archaeon]|nr:GNAT family N-acetyltransferase [Candidatus Pacearchaeota archaeon]
MKTSKTKLDELVIKKLVIKKIKERDAEKVYSLGVQAFEGELWLTRKFIKGAIKNGICFGAFLDKKLLGAIIVKVLDKPKAWIYFFVVDKKYRRKKIGTILLKKAEKKLPKGYYLLCVDLENKDVSGKKFYIKNGFKESAKIKDWFGINKTGIIFTKKIKKCHH